METIRNLLQTGGKLLEKINDQRLIVIVILWLSGLGVITVLLNGCGTVQYEPLEQTQITITNKGKDDGKTTANDAERK